MIASQIDTYVVTGGYIVTPLLLRNRPTLPDLRELEFRQHIVPHGGRIVPEDDTTSYY